MIQLPLDDRYRVNLEKPVLTLDVNQIALRAPSARTADYRHLASIEWNYFETGLLEAVVTPETAFEITKGVPDGQLGNLAYQRYEKSRWLKGRPSGSTLTLTEQESNELWVDIRYRLWPTVTDAHLTDNQRADVSQLFFCAVSSGTSVRNSAFVTLDWNILGKADEMRSAYGLAVMTPTESWNTYESPYRLVQPTSGEIDMLWKQQNSLLSSLRPGG